MIHVIYIPGLGDDRITLQRLAVKLWRIWGVAPHVFHMQWGNDDSYEHKFTQLLKQIDTMAEQGPVALVGASAGASTLINAYAARPQICAAVCIAGKVNNPQSVGTGYKLRSPSFWESAQQSPLALQKLTPERRKRILSVRSAADKIVPARDSIIEGAHNRTTWTPGHAVTIATQLVFGAPFFLRFIKQQNQQ